MPSPQRFTNQVALVTGSTSGIGLAIAEALGAAGAHVVLNGLAPADDAEALRRRLAAEHGVEVAYDNADMRDADAIASMLSCTLARFGRLDILVNNAGIQHVAPIDEFPAGQWDAVLAINLSAAFHTIRHALPAMKRAGFGRVVNIASAHALVASPFKSAYVAAKHGIAGLTKAVALEVAEQNITVNAVCPGYVLTPLVQRQIPDTARARGLTEDEVVRNVLLAAQPTRKFVTAEEVAALVRFLCGRDAASITGAVLPIEGGWTAH
jgi:3-hydroxybutyrate dehydrogenase